MKMIEIEKLNEVMEAAAEKIDGAMGEYCGEDNDRSGIWIICQRTGDDGDVAANYYGDDNDVLIVMTSAIAKHLSDLYEDKKELIHKSLEVTLNMIRRALMIKGMEMDCETLEDVMDVVDTIIKGDKTDDK